MPIKLLCLSCAKAFGTRDDKAGFVVNCPGCQHPNLVPKLPEAEPARANPARAKPLPPPAEPRDDPPRRKPTVPLTGLYVGLGVAVVTGAALVPLVVVLANLPPGAIDRRTKQAKPAVAHPTQDAGPEGQGGEGEAKAGPEGKKAKAPATGGEGKGGEAKRAVLDEILADFRSNPVAAPRWYAGRRLTVVGVVQAVSPTGAILSGIEGCPPTSVSLSEADVDRLRIGQVATVVGTFGDFVESRKQPLRLKAAKLIVIRPPDPAPSAPQTPPTTDLPPIPLPPSAIPPAVVHRPPVPADDAPGYPEAERVKLVEKIKKAVAARPTNPEYLKKLDKAKSDLSRAEKGIVSRNRKTVFDPKVRDLPIHYPTPESKDAAIEQAKEDLATLIAENTGPVKDTDLGKFAPPLAEKSKIGDAGRFFDVPSEIGRWSPGGEWVEVYPSRTGPAYLLPRGTDVTHLPDGKVAVNGVFYIAGPGPNRLGRGAWMLKQVEFTVGEYAEMQNPPPPKK